MYKFIIPGKPETASRPRVTRFGNTYNPKAKKLTEISWILKSQMLEKKYKDFPLKGPISLDINFLLPFPKNISQKKKIQLNGEPYLKHFDLDNFLKMSCDAMNKVIYQDDSQIWYIKTMKIYSLEPKTIIIISEYENEKTFKHFSILK